MTTKNTQETAEATPQTEETDKNVLGFIAERWKAKDVEFQRRKTVRVNLAKFMDSLLGAEQAKNDKNSDGSDSNSSDGTLFTSSLMTEAYLGLRNQKLFPDRVDFEPDQNDNDSETVHKGKNLSLLGDYTRTKGNYDTMIRESKTDLIFGECAIIQEYTQKRSDDQARKILFKNIDWDCVRPQYGDSDLITLEELTKPQIADMFGENFIKDNDIQCGSVIAKSTTEEKQKEDTLSQLSRSKRYGVLKYYCPLSKRYYCVVGGGLEPHFEEKLTGDDWPEKWTDDDGDAFCPVTMRVYHRNFRGYHGFGVLDMLYPLAYLETVMINSVSHASVLASDPMLVFYADDISDAKKRWNQYLSNKRAGQQSDPFFLDNKDGSSPITPSQISFTPQIDIMTIWKEFVMQEATRRAKIDFELVVTPTADQQRLRKQEFDKVNQQVLGENADVDRDFMLQTIYMLKRGQSDFHDKPFFIEVGEYFYTDLEAAELEQLKTSEGAFHRVETTVRDFIDGVGDVEFTVTPRLDGIMDDQSFLEAQEARADIGLLNNFPEAQRQLSEFYFKKKYGGINWGVRAFLPPQAEAPAGVDPSIAAAAQQAAAPLRQL